MAKVRGLTSSTTLEIHVTRSGAPGLLSHCPCNQLIVCFALLQNGL
jgi:hypothetical protein